MVDYDVISSLLKVVLDDSAVVLELTTSNEDEVVGDGVGVYSGLVDVELDPEVPESFEEGSG